MGDEGLWDGGELLVVADVATVLEDPGKGALHDRATRQHLQTSGASAAADDLEDNKGSVRGSLHQAPGIGPIGEDARDTRRVSL